MVLPLTVEVTKSVVGFLLSTILLLVSSRCICLRAACISSAVFVSLFELPTEEALLSCGGCTTTGNENTVRKMDYLSFSEKSNLYPKSA